MTFSRFTPFEAPRPDHWSRRYRYAGWLVRSSSYCRFSRYIRLMRVRILLELQAAVIFSFDFLFYFSFYMSFYFSSYRASCSLRLVHPAYYPIVIQNSYPSAIPQSGCVRPVQVYLLHPIKILYSIIIDCPHHYLSFFLNIFFVNLFFLYLPKLPSPPKHGYSLVFPKDIC